MGHYDKEHIMQDISALGALSAATLFTLVPLAFGMVDLFLQIFVAMVAIHVVTVIVRTFYFKDRPKKMKHSNYFQKIDASSFPSLHSARAGVYATSYLAVPKLAVLLTIFSLAICYTRIYRKSHDHWDVLGGLVLGVVVGYLSYILL